MSILLNIFAALLLLLPTCLTLCLSIFHRVCLSLPTAAAQPRLSTHSNTAASLSHLYQLSQTNSFVHFPNTMKSETPATAAVTKQVKNTRNGGCCEVGNTNDRRGDKRCSRETPTTNNLSPARSRSHRRFTVRRPPSSLS
ncbi:hypothetical protein MtrunA17_Chr1g0179371 [Medicago truncatula]|uniref:Transmembrane protein, putative n=1 Tax=Medicago truncatula TaxID=3880 RepID=A0A072VJV4_MEDTR|nr:transmembrane protein, putative [Medicago truncatula]RHN79626.1 hypothetical protein MtrunA17_Chr1g0179371 [Medicago truncatula]